MACPKSRLLGCDPAALGAESFPVALRVPGLRLGALGIGPQAGEDGVADLPFQGAEGFPVGLALGQFLVVVGTALAVRLADLGDGGHMDGVAVPPVPAPGQPVDLPLPEETSIGAVPL